MFSKRFLSEDSDDSLPVDEEDTFEVFDPVQTPMDIATSIQDYGVTRYLDLRRQIEDSSTRPIDDQLEPTEQLREERRRLEYYSMVADTKNSVADKSVEDLQNMVGMMSAELALWRERDQRRVKIRKWLLGHRFGGTGSVDQRRLHHDDGHAPLHDAAAEGNTDIVRLLLQEGASVNLRNKQEMTPLDIAEWHLFNHCGRPKACRKTHMLNLYEPTAHLLKGYGGQRFVRSNLHTRRDELDDNISECSLNTISTSATISDHLSKNSGMGLLRKKNTAAF